MFKDISVLNALPAKTRDAIAEFILTASEEELVKVHAIGPKTAKSIIDNRDKMELFYCPDTLNWKQRYKGSKAETRIMYWVDAIRYNQVKGLANYVKEKPKGSIDGVRDVMYSLYGRINEVKEDQKKLALEYVKSHYEIILRLLEDAIKPST